MAKLVVEFSLGQVGAEMLFEMYRGKKIRSEGDPDSC
jgi:hypothetical protein